MDSLIFGVVHLVCKLKFISADSCIHVRFFFVYMDLSVCRVINPVCKSHMISADLFIRVSFFCVYITTWIYLYAGS